MVRQCPRGHDGTKPGEGADDTSVNDLTRQAPDLAKDRAKQLETKLEVTMAEIQSVGGNRDESAKGVINKISQTGGSAVVRSINCDPSQRWTPVELIRIERGGGAMQSPERTRGRGRGERGGCGRSVRPKPPGRVRPGRPTPIGGLGPPGGPGLAGESERFLTKFKNINLNRNKEVLENLLAPN
jgi:hypothetical protein